MICQNCNCQITVLFGIIPLYHSSMECLENRLIQKLNEKKKEKINRTGINEKG